MQRHNRHYHGPTDDPVRDADRYLEDELEHAQSLPVCYGCGEQITPTNDPKSCRIFGHLYHKDCVAEYALDEIISESLVDTENFVGVCYESA